MKKILLATAFPGSGYSPGISRLEHYALNAPPVPDAFISCPSDNPNMYLVDRHVEWAMQFAKGMEMRVEEEMRLLHLRAEALQKEENEASRKNAEKVQLTAAERAKNNPAYRGRERDDKVLF